jgi:hypothetical protein
MDTVKLLGRFFMALSVSTGLCVGAVHADIAPLVDQAVLVQLTAAANAGGGDDNSESPTFVPPIADAVNASYVSTGGWATTGAGFIDAAAFVFDFNATASVAAATLILPIESVFPQNRAAPIEIFAFSDNGVIEFTDYSVGFFAPIARINAVGLTEVRIDVTGIVNAMLGSSRFAGFRVKSAVAPSALSPTLFPRWTGVKFFSNAALEFVPGPAPTLPADATRFDGFSLSVPNIDAPNLGQIQAQFKLVDPNNLLFQLSEAVISESGGEQPARSGIDLFNCSAFSPPEATTVAQGASSYSLNSGILDVPSVDFNGEQVAVRLELIDGSNPITFETLSIGAIQSGPSDATISALGGGIVTESSQDFIPLCHGWVLIGDSTRNRVVERNLISGETGKTYSFSQNPDQFTLDEERGIVYMTVHPETERLYRLDLNTGKITNNRTAFTFANEFGQFRYSWALRDIALGENGNVFAIMFDSVQQNPENQIPFTDTGLWLGLMRGSDAAFLEDPRPLLEPIRIEYDPVRDHVFLATQSNLATFNFDPAQNVLSFIQGTDIAVGSGCTDFSISPNGNRLAYTCPNGNRSAPEFSIVDMAPDDYFNSDGVWFLGSEPVSATFDSTGTLLIATDNTRLYFFDASTHLILEDFELGLLEGESVRKIRPSKDGNLLYIFLQNEVNDPSSKFYWMPMPDLQGASF